MKSSKQATLGTISSYCCSPFNLVLLLLHWQWKSCQSASSFTNRKTFTFKQQNFNTITNIAFDKSTWTHVQPNVANFSLYCCIYMYCKHITSKLMLSMHVIMAGQNQFLNKTLVVYGANVTLNVGGVEMLQTCLSW